MKMNVKHIKTLVILMSILLIPFIATKSTKADNYSALVVNLSGDTLKLSGVYFEYKVEYFASDNGKNKTYRTSYKKLDSLILQEKSGVSILVIPLRKLKKISLFRQLDTNTNKLDSIGVHLTTGRVHSCQQGYYPMTDIARYLLRGSSELVSVHLFLCGYNDITQMSVKFPLNKLSSVKMIEYKKPLLTSKEKAVIQQKIKDLEKELIEINNRLILINIQLEDLRVRLHK